MEADRISVIIPSRNRPQLLQRAIDSVNRQNHSDVEIIVFDNSSDPPIQGERLRSAFPLRIVRSETFERKPIALNRALRACGGSFIAYLDDDDEYLPRKFEDQMAAFRQSPEAEMVYGNTEYRSYDGTCIIARGPPVLCVYLRSAYIHPNSFTIRRRILDTISFDERMTTYEDVMFIATVLRRCKVAHVDELHAIWYRDKRPDQLTNRNYRRSYRNWKILCEEFSAEIQSDSILKNFFYKKLLLLSLMFFDVRSAIFSLKRLASKVNEPAVEAG